MRTPPSRRTILALVIALIVYIVVIASSFGVSVYQGHQMEQIRTERLMRNVTQNIEDVLYTMNNNSLSFLSSYGTIEQDSLGYARLVMSETEALRLRQTPIAATVDHFVHSNMYICSAMFILPPRYFYSDNLQSLEEDYMGFEKSELYQQVRSLHHNWWSTPTQSALSQEHVMMCSTPIYVEDTTHFIGEFVMNYMLDSLNSLLLYAQPYPSCELFIVNSEGYVFAQTDPLFYGSHLSDLTNTHRLSHLGNASVDFPLLPWKLVMYTPNEVIHASLRSFLRWFILIGFIGLVLIVLCIIRVVRAVRQSSRQQDAMNHELQMAGTIQRSFLPQELPQCPDVTIDAFLRPAKDVAGDMYEIQQVGQQIYFMIGDVSGKGMQASLLMAMINGLFRHEVGRATSPAQIMKELNNAFATRNPQMLFCTMLIGRLNTQSGELLLCNAGHNPPVLSGNILPLLPNIALGILSDYDYQNQSYSMSTGDTLLCYTDGVTEAMNDQHLLFGEQRLLATPQRIPDIVRAVDAFANNCEQSDDITLLSLTLSPDRLILRSIDDIALLQPFLQTQLHLSAQAVYPIALPIEEAVVNSLTHGKAEWVSVSLQLQQGQLESVDIADNGISFDLTQSSYTPQPDQIGGQGILLIRQMTKHQSYHRTGNTNHLRLGYLQTLALLLIAWLASCAIVGDKTQREMDSLRLDSLRRDSIVQVETQARLQSAQQELDDHYLMLPDTMMESVAAVDYVVTRMDSLHDSILLDLSDLYPHTMDVLTFRGNPLRNADFGGMLNTRPTHLQVDWEFTTDIDTRETNKGVWGGGTGWTGQPLLCDSMVVVTTLASRIYFLDWSTGQALQPSLFVGNPIKGTAMIDPLHRTQLYVGQGVKAESPWGAFVVDIPSAQITHFFPEDIHAWRGWGAYDASPLRVGQFIFRPSENGTLYKWYAHNDTLLLHSTLRYRVQGVAPGMEASMACYKNYGYLADNHGNILCVNLNTLRPVWHYDNHDDTDATPVLELEDGVPYLYTGCEVDRQGASGFCYLVKLNGLTGEQVWQQTIACHRVRWNEEKFNEGGLFATPLPGQANCSDLLFVPCVTNIPAMHGDLLALEKATGAIRYTVPLDWYPWMSPVGFITPQGEQFIVVGDTQGRLYLLDGLTGEILDKQMIGANFESSPAVRENQLVIGSRGCKIYKVSIL